MLALGTEFIFSNKSMISERSWTYCSILSASIWILARCAMCLTVDLLIAMVKIGISQLGRNSNYSPRVIVRPLVRCYITE